MERSVPLLAFGRCPVWIVDPQGRVVECNRSARLLECDHRCADECWSRFGLRDAGGRAFCSQDCPIRRRPQDDFLRHDVRARVGSNDVTLRELLTFRVRDASRETTAILHLVVDAPAARDGGDAGGGVGSRARLERLTRRERQVLELLAGGRSTRDIAVTLGISAVTVRNHVQHILAKLDVHGRLPAILALYER